MTVKFVNALDKLSSTQHACSNYSPPLYRWSSDKAIRSCENMLAIYKLLYVIQGVKSIFLVK